MTEKIAATATLVGTMIGAGFLGTPYVISKSGFTIGVIQLVFIALIIGLSTLYLGEVALRTKGEHHLPGYAEKYLGKKGKTIMFVALIFGIYSAITAYLLGVSDSLSVLLSNSTSPITIGLIFWLAMTLLTHKGVRALKQGEEIGVVLAIILIVSISILSFSDIKINNLSYTNLENTFAPFGVILFAFLCFSAIPEVIKILKKEKRKLKSVIFSSIFIALIAYLLFAVSVVGSHGSNTPEIATIALGKPFIFLGIITIFTSYLALSIALTDSIDNDYNSGKNKAWLYTNTPPVIIFLLLKIFEIDSFTQVISIGGVISGGLTALMIILMVRKAKLKGNRAPEYSIPLPNLIIFLLFILFTLGMISQLI